MRFIFIDESGTGKDEKLVIVAGLVVEADSQLLSLEASIASIIQEMVPRSLQPGFVFHATDILNHKFYRDVERLGIWPLIDKIEFINAIISLPRIHEIPFVFALERDWADYGDQWDGWSYPQMRHFFAFARCLERADKTIRDFGGPNEIGFVVAEEVESSMARKLAWAPTAFSIPFVMPGHLQRQTEAQQKSGEIPPDHIEKIERIRRNSLFVKKNAEPCIWVADACAFALRRYFLGLKSGDTFVEALFGGLLHKPDWEGPSSSGAWSWKY